MSIASTQQTPTSPRASWKTRIFGEPSEEQKMFQKFQEGFRTQYAVIQRYEQNEQYETAQQAVEELTQKYIQARGTGKEKLDVMKGDATHAKEYRHYTRLLGFIDQSITKLQRDHTRLTKKIAKQKKNKSGRLIDLFFRIFRGDTEYAHLRESSTFDDLMRYTEGLIRDGRIEDALAACQELTLRHQKARSLYDDKFKRLERLAISDIPGIAQKAKDRIRELSKNLKILDERLKKISIATVSYEKKKDKILEKRAIKEKEDRLKSDISAIERTLKNGRYAIALGLAKKLIIDYPDESRAKRVYKQTEQKCQTHQKKKNPGSNDEKWKVRDFLKEAGIEDEAVIAEEIKPTVGESLGAWFGRVTGNISNFRKNFLRRSVEVERRKALSSIDKMISRYKENGEVSDTLQTNLNVAKEGFRKDIRDLQLTGFEFFGEIVSKDEVSGDTFGSRYIEKLDSTVFYLGDATGHGVQAAFTVSMTSKLFYDHIKHYTTLRDLMTVINNDLKKKIVGKFFLTGIFFEWDIRKKKLNFIGGGHDPIYVYRRRTGELEKIIPGGLAIGVRTIKESALLKIREIPLEDGDCLVAYTDGILEARGADTNELYGGTNLETSIKKHCSKSTLSPRDIYDGILRDVQGFQNGRAFDDDVSVYILKRDMKKDIIADKSEIDSMITQMVGIDKKSIKINAKRQTREEVLAEIEKKRYEIELKTRLASLQRLYEVGEFHKLKQEALRLFKEGYANKKVKFYLEKVFKNENVLVQKKLEQKMQAKYNTLREMYRKKQYDIVVNDCIQIIAKNGRI